MSKAFGEHLKELRTTRTKYTQTDMAELLDIDLETYQKYENGELEPAARRMSILTQVFDVDLVKLLEYEDEGILTVVSECREKTILSS